MYGEPTTPSAAVLKLLENVPPVPMAAYCVEPSSVTPTLSPEDAGGPAVSMPAMVTLDVPKAMLGFVKPVNAGCV